jgi:hypothetical protein
MALTILLILFFGPIALLMGIIGAALLWTCLDKWSQ